MRGWHLKTVIMWMPVVKASFSGCPYETWTQIETCHASEERTPLSVYFFRFTNLQPDCESLGRRQAGGVVRCRFSGWFGKPRRRGCARAARVSVPAWRDRGGQGRIPSGTDAAHAPRTPTATAATASGPPSPGPHPGDCSPPSRPEGFPFLGTPLLPPAPRRKGCSRHLLPSASQGISACFFFPAVSYSFSPGKPEECFALQTAERWGGKDNIQGLKKLALAWRISLKNGSEIFCSSLIEVNKVQ